MKRQLYLLLGCLLFCFAITTGAQESRVVSDQFLSPSRSGVMARSTVPSTKSHADIRAGNTQITGGDPMHPCYANDATGSTADNAGTYTVFTRITFPGGELFVSTAGSNYDTVVSVFTYADAGTGLGTPLACSDDATPGSVTTSFIDANLTAGDYIIMVSRYQVDIAGAALNLNLNISMLPQGLYPSNDASNAPIALTAHQAYTQTDIHFATDSTAEIALNSGCEMYNSVWYSYTAPTFGEYQFTSFGTALKIFSGSNYSYATSIGVYTNEPSPSLISCVEGLNYSAVTIPRQQSPGYTVLIRVGTVYNVNLLPGSKYKIKPVVTHVSLSTNDGFDDGLTGWKTTNFGGSDGAIGGNAVITSGATKKTLSQTKTSIPSYVKFVKGGVLHFSAGYTYVNAPSGKFTVTVAYSDGKPNTVVNIPFNTFTDGYVFTPITLASTKVKSVKMMATMNPGSGSSITLNFMVLDYDRDPSTARDVPAAVLPFPTGK